MPPTFTGNPSFTGSGTGAVSRPAADVLDEVVYAANFSGYDESGVSDSSAAIMAADAEAWASNKELVLTGTPRITNKLILTMPTRWRMPGQHFKPGFLYGGSYIIKDGALHDDAIEIPPEAYGTIFDSVAILGEQGNTGDGFYVTGNSVRLINCAVQGMGGDGLRVGSKTANRPSPALAYNADCFRAVDFSAGHNGRDGINIDDLSGVTNANAIQLLGPMSFSNGRHGIFVDNAILGNVITCPLAEGNVGWGIYCGPNALNNVFLGGDVEGNQAGQIYEDQRFANRFIDVVNQGAQYHDRLQNGHFTPVVSGSTTAGSGTYIFQRGYYTVTGRAIQFLIELQWSAHSGGAGNMIVTGLPFARDAVDSNIPNFVPVDVVADGFSLAAGDQIVARYNHNADIIQILVSNGGTLSHLSVPATGTLYLRGNYIPAYPS
ncbi:MAG TPA: hypothetical protein VEC11_01165 [Allosphingosinicella sp.]|nr:hypothetical protein [Allosphingosinicella sp.]